MILNTKHGSLANSVLSFVWNIIWLCLYVLYFKNSYLLNTLSHRFDVERRNGFPKIRDLNHDSEICCPENCGFPNTTEENN